MLKIESWEGKEPPTIEEIRKGGWWGASVFDEPGQYSRTVTTGHIDHCRALGGIQIPRRVVPSDISEQKT